MAQDAATQPAAQEKQANCLACNKPVKKVRVYYRDGKYYCTKKCWRKYLTDKEAKDKEGGK